MENHTLCHESLLIDVTPSDGNSLSFMKTFNPIINISNMIEEDIVVKTRFLYPLKEENAIEDKKILAKKFTSLEVECGKLDYNHVNETKVVIEATIPSKPGAIQRVNVSMSCLPRQTQAGQYSGLIRFEIQGIGIHKVFERTQSATLSPEEIEENSNSEVKKENLERIEILKDGLAQRFGSEPVIKGNRMDNEMYKQETPEKLKLAEEEFSNLIMFLNAFEKKFFLETGNKGFEDGKDDDHTFDMETACDKLFRRMRGLENRFYRNSDRLMNIGETKSVRQTTIKKEEADRDGRLEVQGNASSMKMAAEGQ